MSLDGTAVRRRHSSRSGSSMEEDVRTRKSYNGSYIWIVPYTEDKVVFFSFSLTKCSKYTVIFQNKEVTLHIYVH